MSFKTKVWLQLFIQSLVIFIIGFLSSGRIGIWMAFIVNLFWIVFFLKFYRSQLDRFVKTVHCLGNDKYKIFDLLQKWKDITPYHNINLYYCDTHFPLIGLFKTSPGERDLVISSKVIHILTRNELEAILKSLLLELAQIKSPWIEYCEFADQSLAQFFYSRKFWISPFYFLNTKKRKLLADQLCIQTGTHNLDLALAVWKLDGYAHNVNLSLPLIFRRCLAISTMSKDNQFPEVKDRITSLVGYYPI